jgi:hypothetical protein
MVIDIYITWKKVRGKGGVASRRYHMCAWNDLSHFITSVTQIVYFKFRKSQCEVLKGATTSCPL